MCDVDIHVNDTCIISVCAVASVSKFQIEQNVGCHSCVYSGGILLVSRELSNTAIVFIILSSTLLNLDLLPGSKAAKDFKAHFAIDTKFSTY